MDSDLPGRLIGRGRHADVFELSTTSVLRRYRTGQDATPEAAIMWHIRTFGFPAPEVHRVEGSEMELERIDGPMLLDVLARRPDRIASYTQLLADLHHRLHAIPAPDGLPTPFGRGANVLHLDLQPANIVMSASGPVVLDWGWAAAGPPELDVAHTWLEIATSVVPGGAMLRVIASLGRLYFLRSFLAEFDQSALQAAMPEIARYRLAQQRSFRDPPSRLMAVLSRLRPTPQDRGPFPKVRPRRRPAFQSALCFGATRTSGRSSSMSAEMLATQPLKGKDPSLETRSGSSFGILHLGRSARLRKRRRLRHPLSMSWRRCALQRP